MDSSKQKINGVKIRNLSKRAWEPTFFPNPFIRCVFQHLVAVNPVETKGIGNESRKYSLGEQVGINRGQKSLTI